LPHPQDSSSTSAIGSPHGTALHRAGGRGDSVIWPRVPDASRDAALLFAFGMAANFGIKWQFSMGIFSKSQNS
jgi:hypothetical protein